MEQTADQPNAGVDTAPEAFNFARHVTELNRQQADKLAYVDDHGTLSYAELFDGVARFAAQLLALGVRPEERVLLVMHDNRDWPICFLGCLHAGVVPVAVNTLLSPADYAWMLKNCNARAVLTSAALLHTVLPAMQEAGLDGIPLLVSATGEQALPSAATDLRALLRGTDTVDCAATHRDDIAFWLYSSGSTGRPKATVHTHGNLFATNATYGRHILELDPRDVTFSAAKLFFAYGLGNALTFPLCAGATVVLMAERPTPEAVYRRLVDHQVTVFFGVPTLYAGMLAANNAPPAARLALRRCVSAGEALPAELGRRFSENYGVTILDGIGSTEMLHIFLSNRDGAVRYGTTGTAVPGYQLKLLGEDGNPVASGEIGDLYVRGHSQALMYWRNREKSRDTFLGDWMRTGDKYQCDADGWYTYAGRCDDMLKISGQYVSPFEVESALVEHEAVLEAAVIGVQDDHGLTKGQAYVVPKEGVVADDALASTLRDFLKQRLMPHKAPQSICFVEQLPKTPTGKIQRFRLRERAQQSLSSASPREQASA